MQLFQFLHATFSIFACKIGCFKSFTVKCAHKCNLQRITATFAENKCNFLALLLQQKLALLITIRYQHCRNNWPHFRTLGTGGKLKHHDYKSCKFTTLNTSRKISLILHSHGLLLWKSKLTTERKVKSLTRALLDRISLPRHFSPLQMFRRCDDLLKRPVTFCGNTMETGYFNDLQLAADYKNNLKGISLDAISIQNANKQAAITNCKSIKFMNAVESGTNQEMQIASLWMQLRKKC